MFGPQSRYPMNPDRSYTPPPEANIDTYLSMAATLGLERMVIVHPTPYGDDHSCTKDAVAIFGRHRARAVAVINENWSAKALRELSDAGFCAARINSITANGTPLSQLHSVAKLIAPLGWHIELYIRPEELVHFAESLLSLPVPFVIDHMGRIPVDRGTDSIKFQTLFRLLDSGKAWLKLCGYRSSVQGPPYADLLAPARAIIQAAPERCVWGTDWPHPGLTKSSLPDDGKLLDLLYDWTADQKLVQRILVDNPTQLYGFQT
jgi:predicted TIM-barrel fold metal-dependent hydrolase